MNKNMCLFAALLAAFLAAPVHAQERAGDLGVGAYIGVPFGFSAKYFFNRTAAVDFAMGAQGDNLDVHWDLLTHLRDLWPNPAKGKIPAHLGLGLKVEDKKDAVVGIRFVGGVAYLVPKQPLEIFAEIAPVLRMAPSVGSNFEGGVGVRYYFSLR